MVEYQGTQKVMAAFAGLSVATNSAARLGSEINTDGSMLRFGKRQQPVAAKAESTEPD